MPRPRQGTFEPVCFADGRTVFRGRLRLADGTKSDRFDLPTDMNERQARAYLAGLQAEEDATHKVFKAKMERLGAAAAAEAPTPRDGETVFEYAKRWLKAREHRIASIRDNKSHLEQHVLPVLGPLAMRAFTAKHVETLVAALDAKVTAGELSVSPIAA